MKYRHYILHPDMNNYFVANYSRFTTKPLVQKKYTFEMIKTENKQNNITALDTLINRDNLPNIYNSLVNISVNINVYWTFSSYVFIKLGNIPHFAIDGITIRSETEWVETLEGNWNNLNFDNLDNFEKDLSIMPDQDQYNNNAYGKGNISKKIAKTISEII